MVHLRWLLLGSLLVPVSMAGQAVPEDPRTLRDSRGAFLPDSPGKVQAESDDSQQKGDPAVSGAGHDSAPCSDQQSNTAPVETKGQRAAPGCAHRDPYRRFLNTTAPVSLSPKQKGYLAVRDVIDPFNLLTIVGNSAFTVGLDAHTAYGPGFEGFGRNIGVSLLQDVTGEFIGTFGVCSLFHQDPHYHRLPDASVGRRVVHALVRTVVAQDDNGKLIPNYENFITYPASAEISNLYVPGIHGNAASTWARIGTGLATDPAGNLITEFLPDFAKRVHVRVLFVQQIINQVARSGEN